MNSWNRPQQVGLTLLIVFSIAAAAVAYYGTREVSPSTSATAAAPAQSGPVVSIALPVFDPDVPQGPHRVAFQSACTICHSTQLVFNQPRYSSKKWEESIKKMVTTYGAPIPPAQQAEILAFLNAVHGTE